MSDAAIPIQLRTSPHFRTERSVDQIMRNVALALAPVCLFSIYQFGVSAAALIFVTSLVCIGTEHLFCKLSGTPSTISDWSAAVTGVLLALTLPPAFPLWMAAVAGFVGIAIGKVFFGGLGFNVMNPALVGRAFVQAAFTVPCTTWTPSMVGNRFREFIPSTWTPPFLQPVDLKPWMEQLNIDGFTGATPLALMKFDNIPTESIELLVGTTAGSAGESSASLILICGAYLAFRKMLNWRIVAAVLGSAFVTSGAVYLFASGNYPNPYFTLISGGLMLGAVFMATDMVASPVTPWGIWIYGILIGVITVVIRLFGGLSEGVMYAILLANAASPLISAITQPRRYGAKVPDMKEAS